MTPELSKRVRGKLRKLANLAHEREVGRHLERLAGSFEGWKTGAKTTWDLVDEIHEFHHGPSRTLYSQYQHNSLLPHNVARAVVIGLLREDEVPADVAKAIENVIASYRSILWD